MSIGAITVDEVVGRDTDQQALQETIAAIRSLPEEATGHVHRLLCSLFGDTAVNHIMMSSRGNREQCGNQSRNSHRDIVSGWIGYKDCDSEGGWEEGERRNR